MKVEHRPTYHDDRGRWHVERRADDPPAVHETLTRLETAVAEQRRAEPTAAALARFIETARRDAGEMSAANLTSLQIQASQCGLSRDDRLEVATVILGRDIVTWRHLTVSEASRLHDALDGFVYIAHLLTERGERVRYAECPTVSCPMRQSRRSS